MITGTEEEKHHFTEGDTGSKKKEPEPRAITKDYLNLFIHTVQNKGSVTFVEGSQLLAVDHPEKGYLVVQIRDIVVD